jgi:hypothetical protein
MLCRAVMLCRCVLNLRFVHRRTAGRVPPRRLLLPPNAAMSRFLLVLCVVFMTVFPFLCEQRHD